MLIHSEPITVVIVVLMIFSRCTGSKLFFLLFVISLFNGALCTISKCPAACPLIAQGLLSVYFVHLGQYVSFVLDLWL